MPAFWELYLHAAHRRLGFDVELEPTLSDTNGRPDFRFSRDGQSFLLEATVIDVSEDETRRRKREAVILDVIDRVSSPDFFLGIEVLQVSGQTPSERELHAPIEQWLSSLVWETEVAKSPDSVRPTLTFEARGWQISIEPIPKSKNARGDASQGSIGFGPSFSGVFAENVRIARQLRTKASSYGTPAEPLVIAILCLADFADELDIEQALFGPDVIAVRNGRESGPAVLTREPDGLWQFRNEKRGTRVSGVLSARTIRPWALSEIPTLWHNPWATQRVETSLPWRSVRGNPETRQLEVTASELDMAELFELPSRWPGSDDD